MCAMEDYQVEKAPPEPKDNDTIGPLNDQERQIANTLIGDNSGPAKPDQECQPRLIDRIVIIADQLPETYGTKAKWTVTVLVSAAAAIDSISTNIFYPALPQLPNSLSTTSPIANLALALPTLSSAVFPLYWSHASESFGRRPIYLVALLTFAVFSALSAISTSIGMLIAFRMISAGAGAAVTPAGAGVVADIWRSKEKGKAMSVYYVGILLGPALGPILGGLLTQRWDWRATQWFQMTYGGLILLLVLFLLPETFSPRQRARSKSSSNATDAKEKGKVRSRSTCAVEARPTLLKIRRLLTHPVGILIYLRFPAIVLPIYLASTSFCVVKALQISLQQSFSSTPYNFSPLIIGLVFIPFASGLILGDLLGGRWSDHVMHRSAVAAGRYNANADAFMPRPQDRLRANAWVAVVGLPVGLMWYGWSVKRGVVWGVPLLAIAVVGLSVGLIFSLVTTILVEVIPSRSTSLVALNGLGRNLCATVGTAMAQPLQAHIGSGWLFSICALLMAGNVGVIVLMRLWGDRWIERVLEAGENK